MKASAPNGRNNVKIVHPEAVEAVAESLVSDNPTVRLKAATWVLERADLGIGADGTTEFEMYVREVRSVGR